MSTYSIDKVMAHQIAGRWVCATSGSLVRIATEGEAQLWLDREYERNREADVLVLTDAQRELVGAFTTVLACGCIATTRQDDSAGEIWGRGGDEPCPDHEE